MMSQSGYWSYISVNNFQPLVVAFCTFVKNCEIFYNILLTYLDGLNRVRFHCDCILYGVVGVSAE